MVYKWYILPIGGLYATYHLLGEPETTIDYRLDAPNNDRLVTHHISHRSLPHGRWGFWTPPPCPCPIPCFLQSNRFHWGSFYLYLKGLIHGAKFRPSTVSFCAYCSVGFSFFKTATNKNRTWKDIGFFRPNYKFHQPGFPWNKEISLP